jgi:hypothetical protein
MTLLCKKITVAKFREVKTGRTLAESSKEGSKRAVLPMMMMMMIMISILIIFFRLVIKKR